MFLEVLEGHVQSYVKTKGMATAQWSKSNQPTISSADNEPAAAEEEKRGQQLQEQEMAEEREEEKAEKGPRSAAAPLTFDPKAGEVVPEIKFAQATVEEKSRQNLKRTVSLAKENLESARATRNEKWEPLFEEVEMDEDRAPLTPPRVIKKQKLKSINN
jgi:hypothetical protein